jgi:transposase
MAIATIGFDLAKPNYPIVGYDEQFKEVKRRTLQRNQVLSFFDRLSPCRVGMELCVGSHYWGRQFSAFGHEVLLIPDQAVISALRDKNKGFFNDARVLAEALTQPNISCVPVKTVDQQELQAVHRMHSQCIKDRAAFCNLTWKLLAEYGIPLPKGVGAMRRHLPELLEDTGSSLSERFLRMLSHRYRQLLEFDEHLNFYEGELVLLNQQSGTNAVASAEGYSADCCDSLQKTSFNQ